MKNFNLNLNKTVATTKEEIIQVMEKIASIHGTGAPFIAADDSLLLPVRWVRDESGTYDTYEQYDVYKVTKIATCLGQCTLTLQTQNGNTIYKVERSMELEKVK